MDHSACLYCLFACAISHYIFKLRFYSLIAQASESRFGTYIYFIMF